MDDWLRNARDVLAAAAGVEPSRLELTPEEERALLDLARIAAHVSGERINAPLLCYLAGRAAAQGTATVDELADAVRQAAQRDSA